MIKASDMVLIGAGAGASAAAGLTYSGKRFTVNHVRGDDTVMSCLLHLPEQFFRIIGFCMTAFFTLYHSRTHVQWKTVYSKFFGIYRKIRFRKYAKYFCCNDYYYNR